MRQTRLRGGGGAHQLVAAVTLVIFALSAPAVSATDFTVNSTADAGAGTLRDALAAAAANSSGSGPHTILMSLGAGPATIALAGPLTLPNTTDVTIDGALSGGARVVISGAAAGSGFALLSLLAPESGAAVRFQNADFADIGFVLAANELSLTNSSLVSTRPAADNLKAVAATNARVALRSVRFEGFQTIASSNVGNGAALDVRRASTLDAADVAVVNCAALNGAAMSLWNDGSAARPRASCLRCAFVNNSAAGDGGAVVIWGADAAFEQCRFEGNNAQLGGAVSLRTLAGTLAVARSYFYQNAANGAGGAVYAGTGTALTARASTAANNTAGTEGGGFHVEADSAQLDSLTLLNNAAGSAPALRISTFGAVNLTNSILWSPSAFPALAAAMAFSARVRLTNNIIKGLTDTVGACTSSATFCATGTIRADPQLVEITEPQPDGSPIDTFWVPASGCSPAVNTGDASAGGGGALDMRGVARPVGPAPDRGAVEYVPSGPNGAPNVTRSPVYTVVSGTTLAVGPGAGLRAYASDPECDLLTVSLATPPPPGSGTAVVNPDGSFTFVPAPGFVGAAAFVFSVSDGAQSAQGNARVDVLPPPNSPPIATPKAYRAEQNSRVQRAAPGLLQGVTDPDTGAAGLAATAGTFATQRGGTVTVEATGAFSYAPALNFVGDDTFTYTARDAAGAVSAPATVTVTLDAPAPSSEPRAVVAGVDIDAQVDAAAAAEFAEALGPPTATAAGVSEFSAEAVTAAVARRPASKAAKMVSGVVGALRAALNDGVPPRADGAPARAVAMPAISLPSSFQTSPSAPAVAVKMAVPVSAKMPALELEGAISVIVANPDAVMPPALRAEVGVRSLALAVAPALATCDTGTAPAAGGCVCAPGDGGATCARCASGTFSPGGRGAECRACSGDTYAKPGALECAKCDAPGAVKDHSACRKPPARGGARSAYTASTMARLRVPAPGLLTGVAGDFAPLTVSLKDPALNGTEQADGSSVTVHADGSFVFTPPKRRGGGGGNAARGNATIEFRVTDTNGDALDETVAIGIEDKPPALPVPTLHAVNFTVCAGVNDPLPQCTPGRVLASPRFTAGAIELLSSANGGVKARGAPKGVDLKLFVAFGAAPAQGAPTECVAALPKLKVGPGGAAPAGAFKCPGCKRCVRRLGLAKGDALMAAVRARRAGQLPPSDWSAAVAATL